MIKLGTQIKNDGLHKRVIFFFEIRSKMTDCWLFCYLNVSPTISQTYIYRCCSNFAQIRNDGKQKNIIVFGDQIQDGRLAAISFLKCVPNHLSETHGLILFKLGTRTANDGIHMHLTLFCDLIKYGQLVDWRPFYCKKKQALHRTCPQPYLRHAFTDHLQTWHRLNEWWLAQHVILFFRDQIEVGSHFET